MVLSVRECSLSLLMGLFLVNAIISTGFGCDVPHTVPQGKIHSVSNKTFCVVDCNNGGRYQHHCVNNTWRPDFNINECYSAITDGTTGGFLQSASAVGADWTTQEPSGYNMNTDHTAGETSLGLQVTSSPQQPTHADCEDYTLQMSLYGCVGVIVILTVILIALVKRNPQESNKRTPVYPGMNQSGTQCLLPHEPDPLVDNPSCGVYEDPGYAHVTQNPKICSESFSGRKPFTVSAVLYRPTKPPVRSLRGSTASSTYYHYEPIGKLPWRSSATSEMSISDSSVLLENELQPDRSSHESEICKTRLEGLVAQFHSHATRSHTLSPSATKPDTASVDMSHINEEMMVPSNHKPCLEELYAKPDLSKKVRRS